MQRRRTWLGRSGMWTVLSCAAALLLAAHADASAEDSRQSDRKARTKAALRPVSIGSPTDGRLENGVELEPSERLVLKRPRGPRWGLPQLVGMLERSARRVANRFPGSVLLVGDLSGEHGGDLGGHRSHESGRDADVGFYFVDKKGRPVAPRRFHSVDERGRSTEDPALTFDDARNWALVQAWVTDRAARVEHIFVAKPIRARLLAYARARGVYLPVLHRASLALKQPSRGASHDDHFHVRIACPRAQRDVCLANPPARGSRERRALVDRDKGRKNEP